MSDSGETEITHTQKDRNRNYLTQVCSFRMKTKNTYHKLLFSTYFYKNIKKHSANYETNASAIHNIFPAEINWQFSVVVLFVLCLGV